MDKNEFQYDDNVSEMLLALYQRGKDVTESEIPKELRQSFDTFMNGQTCYKENDEFVYYFEDFRMWYMNIPV